MGVRKVKNEHFSGIVSMRGRRSRRLFPSGRYHLRPYCLRQLCHTEQTLAVTSILPLPANSRHQIPG